MKHQSFIFQKFLRTFKFYFVTKYFDILLNLFLFISLKTCQVVPFDLNLAIRSFCKLFYSCLAVHPSLFPIKLEFIHNIPILERLYPIIKFFLPDLKYNLLTLHGLTVLLIYPYITFLSKK